MGVLSNLVIHPCLRARIHRVHPRPATSSADMNKKLPASDNNNANDGFVLYLPTVSLRMEQNPAFALACHAANSLAVPLVVLAVVVDDASHACAASPHRHSPAPVPSSSSPNDNNNNNASLSPSVVMTSRRLAFTLQALSHACSKWSEHGAAVGIRIHAANTNTHPAIKGARTPDHLTLATRASLVVTDEPFVSPFTTLVQKVEEACKRAHVECVRVDGSCTVPPVQVLRRRNQSVNVDAATMNNIKYDGVPAKAYQWQSKTEHLRESHLQAAMEGHFDAPELVVKMDDEDLFCVPTTSLSSAEGKEQEVVDLTIEQSTGHGLAHLFPSRWKPKPSSNADDVDDTPNSLPAAPHVRPFTSSELSHLYETDDYFDSTKVDASQQQKEGGNSSSNQHDNTKLPFYSFATNWPGADPSVPPCMQTICTTPAGMNRWNNFVQKGGLSKYGKERNDARSVHSVSRMSAYLNLGIVSIFRLVWEVKRAQKQQQKGKGGKTAATSNKGSRWGNRNKSGADKFEEEIVKWREMSYAHAFSRLDYDDIGSLPRWSVSCLNGHSNRSRYTIEQLANGTTGNEKWDAMQQYLVRTGELHNNVRMTWGKTAVEWVGCTNSTNPANGACSTSAHVTSRTLCYLNDRYALDGLSPPSYAGLLWCMGWTEKPNSGNEWSIPTKPAYRYKMNAEEFQAAEQKLLASWSDQSANHDGGSSGNADGIGRGMKRQRSVLDMMKMQKSSKAQRANATAAVAAANSRVQIVTDNQTTTSNADASNQMPASKEIKLNESGSNFTTGAAGGMKRKRSVLDMMKMQSSDASQGSSTFPAPAPVSLSSTVAAPINQNITDNQTSATIADSKQNSSTKGMKRSRNESTIDSFFSKTPKKKVPTEDMGQIIG